jgi:hypothetical protein
MPRPMRQSPIPTFAMNVIVEAFDAEPNRHAFVIHMICPVEMDLPSPSLVDNATIVREASPLLRYGQNFIQATANVALNMF